MAKITVENKVVEVLEVEIGEKTYNIPLGSSLTYKKLNSLKTTESFMQFFMEYIPEDIFDTLSIANISAIIKEWNKATEQASGISLGK